jgi:sporulation protein YlmC with PRC-barrel domain
MPFNHYYQPMKKTILLGVFLAVTSLALAQTQSTTTTTSYLQTSTVIGSKIKDSRGQDVGVIKDFVLDRNTGCLAYVVLSAGAGGVLTTSTKTVAAPWTVFTASSDPKVYITRVEREKIYGAPVWESTRIEEYSRTEYINSVYGYYGIAAPRFDAQMSVGVTNTNTSNTSTTTTGATAAPIAAPSTAPAATPAATVKPMPSAAGTPEHTPIPPVTAPPSSSKAPAPASTRAPVKETSSPSTKTESKSEKKSADEPRKKSEKPSTKTETRREKTEPETEPPSKSTRQKKEPTSEPEAASTPKEP